MPRLGSRILSQSFDALVDHADGRAGRSCVRGPPRETVPELSQREPGMVINKLCHCRL